MERIQWKDKLKSKAVREFYAGEFACYADGGPVYNAIYDNFPECQRHTNDPKADKIKDKKDIRTACETFNVHSNKYNSAKYDSVVARKYRKKNQQDLTKLIPSQTQTAKGIYEDVELLNETLPENSAQDRLNQTKARNESLDAQAKFLEHAMRLLNHLSHADSAEKN